MKSSLMTMLRRQRFLRELLTSLVCASMAMAPSLNYASPLWWPDYSVLNLAKPPEDYAAANIGQVKELARKAAAAMDQRLAPDGAGLAIRSMITAWNNTSLPSRKDYAVVNLGQLKQVVKPFYDRLASVGARPAGVYPWAGGAADDYSPANLGQVKNAFAFDLENLVMWNHQSTQRSLFVTFTVTGGGTGNVEPGETRQLQIFTGYNVSETWRSNFGGTETRNHRVEPAAFSGCTLSVVTGDGSIDVPILVTDTEGHGEVTYIGGQEVSQVNLMATKGGVTRLSNVVLRPEWAYMYTARGVVGTITIPEGSTDVPFGASRQADFVAELYSKDIFMNAQWLMQERNYQTGSAEGATVNVVGSTLESTASPQEVVVDAQGQGSVTLVQGADADTTFYFNFFKGGHGYSSLTTDLLLPLDPGVSVFHAYGSSLSVEAGPEATTPIYPGDQSQIYANVRIHRWERWRNDRGYENHLPIVSDLGGAEVRFIPQENVDFPGTTWTVETDPGAGYTNYVSVSSDYAGQARVDMRTTASPYSTSTTRVEARYTDYMVTDGPLLKATAQVSWSISEPPPVDTGGGDTGGGDTGGGQPPDPVVDPPPTIYTPPETYDSWTPPEVVEWHAEYEEEEEEPPPGDGGGGDAGGDSGDDGAGSTDPDPVEPVSSNENPGEEEPEEGQPPAYTVSTSDSAGPRYRKISLQGLPLPDGKPQEQSENGEHNEETYIDAFTGELRHSVSDVYVAIEGTELPLMVRRDAAVGGWQLRGGLRPEEMPDLPFGAGWQTNICSYVHFEGNETATVVDEMGVPQRFLQNKNFVGLWLTPFEESTDIKSSFNVFNAIWDTWTPSLNNNRGYHYSNITLKKKQGTICRYQMCEGVKRVIKADRLKTDSPELAYNNYARLTEVEDRMGNKLVYEYPDPFTLIPSCVYDPARSSVVGGVRTGHRILIESDGLRVTSVTGPGGHRTEYSYQAKGVSFEWVPGRPNGAINADVLITVSRVSGTSEPARTVNYNYTMRAEHGTSIKEQGIPSFGAEDWVTIAPHHVSLDLWKIQNESGEIYEFIRTAPSPRLTYHSESPTRRLQLGSPWPIQTVNGPEGQSFSLTISRSLYSGPNQVVHASLVTTILNGPGGQYTYFFSNPVVLRPYGSPVSDTDPNSKQVSLGYQTLEILSPLGGIEKFQFDGQVSMALKSAIDMSGNETRFVYGTGPAPFDDPLKEINALQGQKVFTYDPDTRILTSMTDESGVKTSYTVDQKKRRTRELVESPTGVDLKETLFEYTNTVFPGFVTKKTTRLIGSQSVPYSQSPQPPSVVAYEPDAQGRVWKTKTYVDETNYITTETTYTLAGDKLTERDGLGRITSYEYDAFRKLRKVINPDDSFKTMEYDVRGNIIKETNELGVSTFYAYDGLNRRVSTVVDINGNNQPDLATGIDGPSYTTMQIIAGAPSFNGDIVTLSTYNERGQVVTQTDARGKVTINSYDGIGRLLSTMDGGRTTTFTYNGPNTGGGIFDVSSFKPTSMTEPNGLVTTYEYDKLYRNTKKTREGAVVLTSYDAMGRVVAVRNPKDRLTVSTYDLLGNLVKTTHPATDASGVPATEEKWYTHEAKPWKAQGEKGNATLTYYDRAGRAYRVEAPSPEPTGTAPVTLTTFDANGNAISVTDPLGRVTTTEYDARNRPVKVTTPLAFNAVNGQMEAGVTETSYDHAGRVTKVKDANGGETRKFYDRAGRVWKVVDPMGNATLTTYDASGNVVTVTDQEGRTSTSVYDAFNKVLTKTDPLGVVTSYEYDLAGNQTKITDGLGRSTTSVFDKLNRLVSQRYENGDTFTYTHDSVHKLSSRDPMGNLTKFVYDNRDRQIETQYYIPQTVQVPETIQVPQAGVSVCSLSGSVIEWDPISIQATARAMQADGTPTSGAGWSWSISGNVPPGLSFENGLLHGHFTSSGSYTFTVTASAGGISGSTTSTILVFLPPVGDDPAPETHPPAAGVYPAYTVPTQPQQIIVPQILDQWQFTRATAYDAEGNITSVTETGRPWADVTYEFDRLGRRVAETSRGVRHTYSYDLAGNELTAVYGTGSKVVTTYDRLNRPVSMTETKADGSGTPRVTTYGYDRGGRAVQLVNANGQVTRNSYDGAGRLLKRALYKDAPSFTTQAFQSSFEYVYDKTGNVKSQAESWPGSLDRVAGTRTTTMVYDDASRLVTEIIDDPVAAQDMTTVYGYDGANNRTSKFVLGGQEPGYWTYEHNSANQLTGWTKWSAPENGIQQRSATLAYNANGNRTSQVVGGEVSSGNGITPPNVENGTTTYLWDHMNRLTGVVMPSGRSFAYQYDYRSRRVGISETQASVTTHTAVVFSEGLSIAEYESTSPITSTTGLTPEVQYVRGTDMGGGIGGMLYTLRDDNGTLKPKYDLSNGRGDVVAQSDSSGALTWTASYEAFGRRTVETGVNEDKQRANSKDEDPTGLLNEGFRYRDLETGVFLSRDPAGTVDGPNVYTYVNQNPWTKFDPEGLFWHIAVAGLIGAAISVGAQVVSDVVSGKMSDASTYASAAVGGAVSGATLAATGSPTLAGAAGAAASSATGQFMTTGTVDGGQVLKDAAVGAVEGGMGGAVGKALGCGASKVVKALGGAAADAATAASGQIASNVLEGKPPMEGTLDAMKDSVPGMGLVAAVQQRESCFLAGTSVTLGSGDKQAIETLVIGQRVLTPESTTQTAGAGTLAGSETQVDPATWRSYTVRLRDGVTKWDIFDITLLRPAGWMAAHSRPLGGGREVWVDFEELNARGWAEVIEERPCPKIAEGPGRVVTATITHANDDVRTLTMSSGETLYVTGNHRMFSATRADWVAVKDLHIGEELRTAQGRESVASLGYQRGRHQVYNIEVETEHCYFVGDAQALSHNTGPGCSVTDSANNEKSHGHHSDPKFMGGDPKQELTQMPESKHKELHKDLNAHLKQQTDGSGNDMMPRRGNSGAQIQKNFSLTERRAAVAEFYNKNKGKYPQAAKDFFKQHPTLKSSSKTRRAKRR